MSTSVYVLYLCTFVYGQNIPIFQFDVTDIYKVPSDGSNWYKETA
jgi:hypothetical protein